MRSHIMWHCGISGGGVFWAFSRQFPKGIPLKEHPEGYEPPVFAYIQYRESGKQSKSKDKLSTGVSKTLK